MASTNAKIIAEKKPEVLKSSIKLSTNKTIKTVMMKDINPKVKKLIGNVSTLRIRPIVAFANAINTPAIIADKNPSTCTPGIRKAAKTTAKPINRISIISFIILILENV